LSRGKNPNEAKTKTIPLTVHVEPGVKQRLQHLAAGQKDAKLATLSGITNAMIRRGMVCEPDKPYGPSLEPVIQGALDKGFARHDNRLAALQARDTFAGIQALHLIVNTFNILLAGLNHFDPVAEGTFQRIVEESENKAREALTSRDPSFLELVKGTYLNPATGEEAIPTG